MNPWRKRVLHGIGLLLIGTIALAILSILTGQSDLWSYAFLSLGIIAAYGSVFWFTVRWLDDPRTRPMGIQACAVMMVTLVLFQLAVWIEPLTTLLMQPQNQNYHFYSGWIGKMVAGGFAILGAGIASLVGLSSWCQFAMKRAGWASQITAITCAACWIAGILLDHASSLDEKFGLSGFLALGVGALASGILLGEKAGRWTIAQWLGVAASLWVFLVGLTGIWLKRDVQTISIWTGPMAIALWIGFVSQTRMLTIPRSWKWMYPVSRSLAAVGLLALFVLTCIEAKGRLDNPTNTFPFILSRGGMILMLLAIGHLLFMAVLNRANKKLPSEIIDKEIKSVSLTCPRCQLTQNAGVGQAGCSQCGLKFKIEVYTPVCAKCGYVLYGTSLTACPDCGHALPPSATKANPPADLAISPPDPPAATLDAPHA